MNSKTSNSCSFHFLRLLPDQDVRKTLQAFCIEKNIDAASIISSVGSLKKIQIRKANSDNYYESNEPHELISLSGLLSKDGLHIHLSVADKNAQIFGGHLSEGNLVFTTLELVIAQYSDIQFNRKTDSKTGYLELSFD